MKAKYKLFIVIMFIGITVGCDDFLERSSQNLIVPETVKHYKELLQGDGYFKDLYEKTKWDYCKVPGRHQAFRGPFSVRRRLFRKTS